MPCSDRVLQPLFFPAHFLFFLKIVLYNKNLFFIILKTKTKYLNILLTFIITKLLYY